MRKKRSALIRIVPKELEPEMKSMNDMERFHFVLKRIISVEVKKSDAK
jgi:hypothetical protein